MGEPKKKILVLVVDLDNDLERAGLATPIVGRDSVVRAAVDFALKYPEDSDANAMFAGLKILEELRSGGYDAEIAVVGGSPHSHAAATMRIREDVEKLVRSMNINGIYVVSDGVEDELVIPILQSIAPVVGLKRTIVEQLRGVEETYVLIGRYLKKVLLEPRLARLFLGVPGLIILIVSILSVVGLLSYATTVTLFLVGAAMIVRGFDLEDKISALWSSSPIMFISYTASFIFLVAAIGIASYTMSSSKPMDIQAVGNLLEEVAPLGGLVFFAPLTGRIIVKLIERNLRVWYEVLSIVLVVVVVMALESLSKSLVALPPSPTPATLTNVVFGSGAIQMLLIGIGVIGGLTVVARFIENKLKGEEEASDQTVSASSGKSV